jgi:aryl-alcohol dehydrogenase-like predicted oxidoreductase
MVFIASYTHECAGLLRIPQSPCSQPRRDHRTRHRLHGHTRSDRSLDRGHISRADGDGPGGSEAVSAGGATETDSLRVPSAVMEYRRLGPTGTIVSAHCLGTMTFGQESDEETAHAQLDLFVERGGNFVDTADVYSRGRSEAIIGEWLAAGPGRRDRLVIGTKARFAMGDGPNDAGLSRAHLGRALEASLRRLGVDTIDLYQAHAWDPLTPLEETLGFFDDAVRSGKVRYVGVSNFVGWQLQKAALLASEAAPIVTLQPQYNLLVRDIELELVDVCRNEAIGILPWSPLAGGWLTGKYERDQPPTGATRLGEDPGRGMEAYGPRNAQERTWRVIDVLREIAEGRGVPMSQVALAWIADRPAVTSVVLGARTLAQLDDNLGAAGLHLSDAEAELLDARSAPAVADYPYGSGGIEQRSRHIG